MVEIKNIQFRKVINQGGQATVGLSKDVTSSAGIMIGDMVIVANQGEWVVLRKVRQSDVAEFFFDQPDQLRALEAGSRGGKP